MNQESLIHLFKKISFCCSNYLLNRKKILWIYKNLLDSEKYPEELLSEIQLKKFKLLVKYAYELIPYYRNKFKEIGLLPQDISKIEDIKLIPTLSRDDVIEHYKEMVAEPFSRSIEIANKRKRNPGNPIPFAVIRKHKLVKNTSSGSTGAPTIFYEDGSQSALNWAHEMRLKKWFGIEPIEKEVRMVRLSLDYLKEKRIYKIRKFLWNQLILPGINLGEKEYEICISEIIKFKPKVIWGFTSAIVGLIEFIKEKEYIELLPQPKIIIGWAAPVYDYEERKINEILNCPVSNIYGAREVGHIAGRCPDRSFHINQESYYVEINREIGNNNFKTEEGIGEILVTTLNLLPMPFIRYRMGDIGELGEGKCSCGRSLQVLKNLLGRTNEIFISKNGKMISPNFWCRTFMMNELAGSVKRFQILYTKNKDIKIKIVKGFSYSNNIELFLKNYLKKNFGKETKIEIIYTSEIKPLISGKYQMVMWE